mgnify:CR=1 FL=1
MNELLSDYLALFIALAILIPAVFMLMFLSYFLSIVFGGSENLATIICIVLIVLVTPILAQIIIRIWDKTIKW